MSIIDCGVADYRQVLEQQYELHEKRRDGIIPDTVLTAEHRPVITLGARQSANKLLVDRSTLAEKGIDVVDIRRGGGTTAHNPGQLVFYPILHLQELGIGISEYIRELEAIGIELLQELNVLAERRKGLPGLWIGEKKIASIGVRVSKYVTCHGMAINICNDLSIFDYIVPCGLDGVEMTSVLKETGRRCSMTDVRKKLSQLLIKHFSIPNELRATPVRRSFSEGGSHERRKLPPWLKRPLPVGGNYAKTSDVIASLGLQTICHSANCPNRGECWEKGTATVLILGNICTRNCGFCSVKTGRPAPPDPTEPQRLAEMVKQMGLKYLVITSVNRDDLPDGGAGHFRDCIRAVRRQCPEVKIEILTPDFRYCQNEAIEILATEILSHREKNNLATEDTEDTEVTELKKRKSRGSHRGFVFAHNVETVPSLYSKARQGGNYQRSLNLLKLAKQSFTGVPIKSSIMLGLGETDDEVEEVLRDLRGAGCGRITIGQYLKPSKNSLEVVEYIPPEKFDLWKQKAVELGFSWVLSSPYARSSYFAEKENTL